MLKREHIVSKMKGWPTHNCNMRVLSKNNVNYMQEKGRYRTQSYDKSPYTDRKFKKAKWKHENVIKNFDYFVIADRLRTMSFSSGCHKGWNIYSLLPDRRKSIYMYSILWVVIDIIYFMNRQIKWCAVVNVFHNLCRRSRGQTRWVVLIEYLPITSWQYIAL